MKFSLTLQLEKYKFFREFIYDMKEDKMFYNYYFHTFSSSMSDLGPNPS